MYLGVPPFGAEPTVTVHEVSKSCKSLLQKISAIDLRDFE